MKEVYAAKCRMAFRFYDNPSKEKLNVSVFSLMKARKVKIHVPSTWKQTTLKRFKLYLDKRNIKHVLVKKLKTEVKI